MTNLNSHSKYPDQYRPHDKDLSGRDQLHRDAFLSSVGLTRPDPETLLQLHKVGLEGVLAIGLCQQAYFKLQKEEGGYCLLNISNSRALFSFGAEDKKPNCSRVSLNLSYIGTEFSRKNGEAKFCWAWTKNDKVNKQPTLNEYQGRVVDKLSAWAEAASYQGQPFFNNNVMQKIVPWSGQSVGLQSIGALLGANPTGAFLCSTYIRQSERCIHYYLIEKDLLVSPGEPGYFNSLYSESSEQAITKNLEKLREIVYSALFERAIMLKNDREYRHTVSVNLGLLKLRIDLLLNELAQGRPDGGAGSIA